MHKHLLLMMMFFINITAMADVHVTISDGIYKQDVKRRMEQSMSLLLSRINSTDPNVTLNYTDVFITPNARGQIDKLWQNMPFRCTDNEIVEHCLTSNTGYQVRNIPLIVRPADKGELSDDDLYQEAVFKFDKQGNIVWFSLTIPSNMWSEIIKSPTNDVTDMHRREIILSFVERFRTAYNQKDLHFLNQIFSDDALIITGQVVKQKPRDGIKMQDEIIYRQQKKVEYLNKLKSVFQANKYIHVTFDEVEVSRHGVNPNIYGVTLHQGYTSDRYHDDGYVFLLWDFKDEDNPQIHVRTWQPDRFNGQRLPREQVFNLNSFDLK